MPRPAFTATTAEAAERVRARIEAEARREEDTDWVTWLIDVLVAPSVANQGEQMWLYLRDIMRHTVDQVIAEIQEAEQMTLDPTSGKRSRISWRRPLPRP